MVESQTGAYPQISIIIPTYNGARRIERCLEALRPQVESLGGEILVVDDGSTDDTAAVLRSYAGVRILAQANAGPAAARNHGAREARGRLILFTDDDCEPADGWLAAMLQPFEGSTIVGTKGVYRTRQRELVARFVQAEYEDKYRYMARFATIDFIDTYSAAFVRERFVELDGYDTEFPVACAEDVELSYRMSARGWKMIFVPGAVVYHQHPNTLKNYLRKKYKFAFWRMLAVRKNPAKGAKDTHTPQLMKAQLLLVPALAAALAIDVGLRPRAPVAAIVLVAFVLSTLPFAARAARADLPVGLFSPVLLALRAVAQFLGVVSGMAAAARMMRKAGAVAG